MRFEKSYDADEDEEQADWTKTTWDADLPSTPKEMRNWLEFLGMSVDDFRQSPLYRFNVDKLPWLREV